MNVIYHLETASRRGTNDERARDRFSVAYSRQSPASWLWYQQDRDRRPVSERSRRLLDRLRYWHSRAMQRRHLRQLVDDQDVLHDIGITRADALREADKPFWRD